MQHDQRQKGFSFQSFCSREKRKEKNRTEKNRKEKKRNRFVATFESQKFPKTDRRSSGVNSPSFCNHTHQ
jgi:hypothetical protein